MNSPAAKLAPAHPLKAIRRAGVPIAAFETSDPAATIEGCKRALNGNLEAATVLQWDLLRGLVGLNKLGAKFALDQEGAQLLNPAELLSKLTAVDRTGQPIVPKDAICFVLNAHRLIGNEAVAQGLWNVRDVWKAIGATLILLCPTITLPDELTHDIVVVTEPLPNQAEIELIVDETVRSAGIDVTLVKDKSKIVDTLLGVSAFAAEQALALSINKDGIDRDGLWEKKRKMIEQTPGLSVWRGGDTFSSVGGCDNVKGFLADLFKGKSAPRAVAFVDEIEKSVAGSGADSSGVSQDYLRTLLTYMQDTEAVGMVFVGPPGAAKSAIAKAAGNEAGIPTIAVDLGGMKGSLVGESEKRLRSALKVIDAVSQSKTLFIATCNSLAILPPELKRRFTMGTFFFPLPQKSDRDAIWALYESKYNVSGTRPVDIGWTGAEIKQCCQIAWRLGRSLVESAKFIVPVSVSAADSIDKLCRDAHEKFISASQPGFYQYEKISSGGDVAPGRSGRKMDLSN